MTITIVLAQDNWQENMQRKRKIGFILEAIAVFVIMAVLSSIAVPKIGEMVNREQDDLRADEFIVVKTAVAEMLDESTAKKLQPIGPVQDMTRVQTNDTPPLVLADYLDIDDIRSAELGCHYTFTAEGEVTQDCP